MTQASTNIIKITVPAHLHPLENLCVDFLKELNHFCLAAEQHDPMHTAVLLLQTQPCQNFSDSWLAELRNALLLDELAERIHLLREVCERIRSSHLTWMYAAAGNTFGGFFELALACHKRFWFDSAALVGFPEIESGAYPPGGSIEYLYEHSHMDAAEWAKASFVSVQRALERDWADFVGDARDWQTYAESWLRNMLEQKTEKKSPASNPTYTLNQQRHVDNLKTSNLWNSDHGLNDQLFNAWEASWKLIQTKAKDRSEEERINLFTYLAARHYLSAAYMIWVKRDSWKSTTLHTPPRMHSPDARIVYINLSESLVPPARPLARLLREGYLVVLVGDDAPTLKANLELLYGRFERILSAGELFDLWQRGITWILCATRLPAHKNVLEWTSDERLVIQPGQDDEARFIRLEGNKGSAASGWCEYVQLGQNMASPTSLALATLMSNGIIYTRPVGTPNLPVSMYVRSLFFEEMLSVSRKLVGSLNTLLDELRATGWGFAANQSSWDYFLIHREGDFSMQPQSLAIGSKGLAGFAWQIGHWKSALNYANQQDGSLEKLHAQELSLHFAIYAGIIAKMLVKHGHVRKDFDADTLVKSCLGFPAFHGTPLSFLELRGANRVLYHCQRHWPDLIPEVSGFMQAEAR